jgi:hypothetical protein
MRAEKVRRILSVQSVYAQPRSPAGRALFLEVSSLAAPRRRLRLTFFNEGKNRIQLEQASSFDLPWFAN